MQTPRPTSRSVSQRPTTPGSASGHRPVSTNAYENYYNDHVMRLQADIEFTTRKLELEKRRLHIVRDSLKRAKAEHEEKRMKYNVTSRGDYVPPSAREKQLPNLLKFRVDRTCSKLDAERDQNLKLRGDIDRQRQEMQLLLKSLARLEHDVSTLRKNTEDTSKLRSQMEEENADLTALKAEMVRALSTARMDFKTRRAELQQELFAVEKRIRDGEVTDLKNVANFGAGALVPGLQSGKNQLDTYVLAPDEENFDEPDVMREITRVAMVNAIKKKQCDDLAERTAELSEGFRQIQEATGVEDVDDIIRVVADLDESRFSMLRYANEKTKEVSELHHDIRELKAIMDSDEDAKARLLARQEAALEALVLQTQQTEKMVAAEKDKGASAMAALANVLPLLHNVTSDALVLADIEVLAKSDSLMDSIMAVNKAQKEEEVNLNASTLITSLKAAKADAVRDVQDGAGLPLSATDAMTRTVPEPTPFIRRLIELSTGQVPEEEPAVELTEEQIAEQEEQKKREEDRKYFRALSLADPPKLHNVSTIRLDKLPPGDLLNHVDLTSLEQVTTYLDCIEKFVNSYAVCDEDLAAVREQILASRAAELAQFPPRDHMDNYRPPANANNTLTSTFTAMGGLGTPGRGETMATMASTSVAALLSPKKRRLPEDASGLPTAEMDDRKGTWVMAPGFADANPTPVMSSAPAKQITIPTSTAHFRSGFSRDQLPPFIGVLPIDTKRLEKGEDLQSILQVGFDKLPKDVDSPGRPGTAHSAAPEVEEEPRPSSANSQPIAPSAPRPKSKGHVRANHVRPSSSSSEAPTHKAWSRQQWISHCNNEAKTSPGRTITSANGASRKQLSTSQVNSPSRPESPSMGAKKPAPPTAVKSAEANRFLGRKKLLEVAAAYSAKSPNRKANQPESSDIGLSESTFLGRAVSRFTDDAPSAAADLLVQNAIDLGMEAHQEGGASEFQDTQPRPLAQAPSNATELHLGANLVEEQEEVEESDKAASEHRVVVEDDVDVSSVPPQTSRQESAAQPMDEATHEEEVPAQGNVAQEEEEEEVYSETFEGSQQEQEEVEVKVVVHEVETYSNADETVKSEYGGRSLAAESGANMVGAEVVDALFRQDDEEEENVEDVPEQVAA